MSHRLAVKYVNISEPRILRQLLRRVYRACSMNSWRFPFSSRMGMEQLPSPIKEAIILISPPPHFVSYVTTFVNISFSCSFHPSILLLTSFSPSPLLIFFFYFFPNFSLLLLCCSSQILPYVLSPITFVSGIFIIK